MFEHIHHFQQLSSCVGSNSCGAYFNTAPSDTNGLWFGATHLQGGYNTPLENKTLAGKFWLNDSNSTTVWGTDQYNMAGSNQGMFSSFSSINTFWSDTTNMDNLRGADITASSVAGSTETIGLNNPAYNVRGGHSVHIKSDETYYAQSASVAVHNAAGVQATGACGRNVGCTYSHFAVSGTL